MLRAPSANLARHTVRGMSDRNPQIELEDPGEGTSGMPPAKKIRPSARSPTPEAVPANNKGKKRSITNVLKEDKPSKKLTPEPTRHTRETWESSQVEGNDNNNLPTVVSEPGCSRKKRRRQKRRQTKRARRAQDEKDSGIGSLVDLLDDMVVGDTKPMKPPKPVKSLKPAKHRPKLVKSKSKPLVPAPPKGFDLDQVVEWTRKNSDKDRRKTMTVAALRATVVVDGIPHDMLPFFKGKLKSFSCRCGEIIHYSTHDYLEEAAFRALDSLLHARRAGALALPRSNSLRAPEPGLRPRRRDSGPLADYEESYSYSHRFRIFGGYDSSDSSES